VTEGEKAELHIGDRVPIPTTTFNTSNTVGGNIVPVTSFTYQNTGIQLTIEPRVHHNREVTLKLNVEVSIVSGQVSVEGGVNQPIIGTRQIQTVVRLKDGETNMLSGLIKEDEDYIVLSDIAGVEDHLGDMDFKIAGTKDGITALQMDIKITGVTFDILKDALQQAQDGRLFILGKMEETLAHTREELSKHAPRITTIQIDPSKIGAVIGKGGETIRALSEEYEAQIDVNDEGQVMVYSVNGELGDACIEAIRQMTKEIEIGDTFDGKVVKTTTFGAFVELTKGTDGLIHISNLKPGERAESVEDVVNRGDHLKVRVVELNKERGRIGLRLADDPAIEGKTAEELSSIGTGTGANGGGRGGRDRDGRGRGRDRDRGGRSRDRD